MYPWQSTPEAVHAERQRLLAWQTQVIQERDDAGQPVYDERVPVRDVDRLPELMRQVGCPSQTSERRLSDFTTQPYIEASAYWGRYARGDEAEHRFGMAFLGTPSTGKSSFGVGVLRSAAWNNKTVKFIDGETFAKFHTSWIEMSQNASRYDDYAERADDWRRELWRLNEVYDVLVFDDFGRSKAPAFIYDEFHTLLRTRLGHGLYTLITANASMKEFDQIVGVSCGAFIEREFHCFALTPESPIMKGKSRARK